MPLGSTFEIGTKIILLKIDGFLQSLILKYISPLLSTNIMNHIGTLCVYFDINLKLFSGKNTQKVNNQNIWDS